MLAPPPRPAADLSAAAGAAALAMLALLRGMVWRAQRQTWAALFALCMGFGAIFHALDPLLRPAVDRANPAGSLLGAVLLPTLLAALLTHPAAAALMPAGHVQPDPVRYVNIVPMVMLGMTVLTTGWPWQGWAATNCGRAGRTPRRWWPSRCSCWAALRARSARR